jgi:hypothetical protein
MRYHGTYRNLHLQGVGYLPQIQQSLTLSVSSTVGSQNISVVRYGQLIFEGLHAKLGYAAGGISTCLSGARRADM